MDGPAQRRDCHSPACPSPRPAEGGPDGEGWPCCLLICSGRGESLSGDGEGVGRTRLPPCGAEKTNRLGNHHRRHHHLLTTHTHASSSASGVVVVIAHLHGGGAGATASVCLLGRRVKFGGREWRGDGWRWWQGMRMRMRMRNENALNTCSLLLLQLLHMLALAMLLMCPLRCMSLRVRRTCALQAHLPPPCPPPPPDGNQSPKITCFSGLSEKCQLGDRMGGC